MYTFHTVIVFCLRLKPAGRGRSPSPYTALQSNTDRVHVPKKEQATAEAYYVPLALLNDDAGQWLARGGLN